MNTQEEVIQFKIEKDAKGGMIGSGALASGQVMEVIVNSNRNKDTYLQFQIKDANGVEISKMQHIGNYEMRNAANYYQCGKPLFFNPNNRTIYLYFNCPDGATEDIIGEATFVYECQN
ncbi:hypothetical protein [Flavobacterium sp. CAU 1735]|uniref:hypothetical protein n=1 Tax=Flavobacterium sp. CAU 1735 TaxID=3140361 RepID=UPI003260FE22